MNSRAPLRLEFNSPENLSDADWSRFGFRDIASARAGVLAVRSLPYIGCVDGRIESILACVAATCDPDQALLGLQRWLEAEGTHAISFDWHEERFLKILCMLFAATPALSEYLIRFPARAQPVIQPVIFKQVTGGAAWRRLLHESLAGNEGTGNEGTDRTYCQSPSFQMATLRRMREECMLQIAALDLLGLCPMQDTVRALSDLADACVETALELAIEQLRHRYGQMPLTAAIGCRVLAVGNGNSLANGSQQPAASSQQPSIVPPFVIFALGKLGGRELNYSSDIDLVFAHAGSGVTVGGVHALEAQAYFTLLAEELIASLDKVTEDGRVYRVDLRLRPYGSAGPLVKTAEEMQNYFQTEGRTWERQAWLKARAIAGDLLLGNDLLSNLKPFIFQRYLSLDAIGDLQALKMQIELSVARRGESEDEVKLGRGGIRDVEFTVQFMQLLYGSEHTHVQTGNTLHALYQLRRGGLLTDQEIEPLANAYIFLRNVEHRLQLHGNLQVHKLPSDNVTRRRIALSLGYFDSPAEMRGQTVRPAGTSSAEMKGLSGRIASPFISAEEAFENDRLKYTTHTREVFERLFANLFRSGSGPEGELSDLLLAPQPDVQRIAAVLPKFGFPDSQSTAQELLDLSSEKLVLTSPLRTRKFFAAVAPKLLNALASTGVGDDALRRFSRLAGSLGAKAVFYQMLFENPWMLKMTVDLAAWSEYLTEILVANPGLFDELIDALQTGHSKSVNEMIEELTRITRGGEIADTLRAYRAGELLRIGVRDLIHDASLEQTQCELSDLAEAILRATLQYVVKGLRARQGAIEPFAVESLQNAQVLGNAAPRAAEITGQTIRPVSLFISAAGIDSLGFAVLALGKFGGREMNYGSDLDVLYLYEGEGQTSTGLPAVTYYAELAQELSRAMATATTLGSLYDLDARLRPNGTKGPLALSLDGFKRYWKEGNLADWERLALTRARFVAGDVGVGERAMHLIHSAVYSPLKDTTALAGEVWHIRMRLEDSADHDDIKRGRGGIMDIEFIAQYLQLIHGSSFPPLRHTNTEQALKALVKFGKLGASDGQTLLQGYHFLRTMENRVRIVHGLSAHTLPAKPEAIRKLALRAGFTDTDGKNAGTILLELYHRHTGQVREIFERVTLKGS